MTAAEMSEEAARLSTNLDKALRFLRENAVPDAAETERDYRLAKATAWLNAPAATVPEREAWVNGQTADLRYIRDLAEGVRRTAFDSIRARMAQISLLQSLLSAHRAEAEFVRTAA